MPEPNQPEPWLRGPVAGVHPLVGAVVHSFEQVREDLARHTAGLSAGQVWERGLGVAPLGFHLRHIAGSVDRLTTYLAGGQLDDAQMQALRAESDPGAGLPELLAAVENALARSEAVVRAIPPATFEEPREVGRKRLPTSVAGLLVHLAEHTQRHLGQAIVVAKLLRRETPTD